MEAEDFIKAGNLAQALLHVQDDVRKNPADVKLRILLFQLLSVVGDWQRAADQLGAAAELDDDARLMATAYRPAIDCEILRAEVFAGKKTPLILGQPPEWMGCLVQVLPLLAEGKHAAAAALREQAFEAAPAVSGSVDDHPFEWIADADPRLGPVVEVMLQGRYYWVPMAHIKEIRVEKPGSLRDAVWMPVHFVWSNGGDAAGLIPTRYSGSEACGDPSLQLARRTEWAELGSGFTQGTGQRMLATDEGEYALMDIRRVALNTQR